MHYKAWLITSKSLPSVEACFGMVHVQTCVYDDGSIRGSSIQWESKCVKLEGTFLTYNKTLAFWLLYIFKSPTRHGNGVYALTGSMVTSQTNQQLNRAECDWPWLAMGFRQKRQWDGQRRGSVWPYARDGSHTWWGYAEATRLWRTESCAYALRKQ